MRALHAEVQTKKVQTKNAPTVWSGRFLCIQAAGAGRLARAAGLTVGATGRQAVALSGAKGAGHPNSRLARTHC
jgi:hypothetical protein